MINQLNIRRWLFIGFLSVLAFYNTACSGYQKLLNSDNYEKKYKEAKKYYNQEDYQKAIPLFDDLISYYRGSQKGKKIAYYYSYCHYGIGSYKVAAFRFKNYYKTYSRSEKAEDALYMHAYCLYLQSPPVELDQGTTKKAINAFQLFIKKYPGSDKIDKCNKYLDKLRAKLKKKAYQRAYLWYKILDYKAAVTAFNNLLERYPAIDNRKKVEYLIVESRYKVAQKSVQSKKEERLRKTLQACREFLQRYPQSKYVEDTKDIKNKVQEDLQKYES